MILVRMEEIRNGNGDGKILKRKHSMIYTDDERN